MVTAEQSEGAHLLDDLGGEAVLVLQAGGDRYDLVGHEATDGVDDRLSHIVAGGGARVRSLHN